MTDDILYPGSAEAVGEGCICPQAINHWGDGRDGDGDTFGWVIDKNCPIHGDLADDDDDD